MSGMPHALLVELRDIFNDRFDNEGLAAFALALGVDYENIAGSTRRAKAQNLALYLWRHGLLPSLATVGAEERPDIPWAEILIRHGVIPGVPTAAPSEDAPPGVVSHTDLQKLQPILAEHPMFLTPEGRQALLGLAGVGRYVALDYTGSPTQVAAVVLTRLNDYGRTPEGDAALGRLLAYLLADDALPVAQKDTLTDIITHYTLT